MSEVKACPEFPFFGATYPDATCIDGYLWDLDAYDEQCGGLYKGGEDPCPFCNREEFIQRNIEEVAENIVMKTWDEVNDRQTITDELSKQQAFELVMKKVEALECKYR